LQLYNRKIETGNMSISPTPPICKEEALTGLLVEKGIFSTEEFLEMVKVVNREMKKKGK